VSNEVLRLEYVALRELQRWPRNPKQHDEVSVAASIARFGYIQPAVIDEGTGRLVAGHGRLDALCNMRDRGEDPPARILVVGNDWQMPVLRGVAFKDEHEAEAFLLADNQTTILGGWDDAALVAMLAEMRDIEVPIIGWDDDAIDALTGAQIDLTPPEVTGGIVGGEPGIPMRQFRFSLPETEADDVDAAFAKLRGGHRDLSDGQLFVAVCRTVLKR
jgi:hypothetical protein